MEKILLFLLPRPCPCLLYTSPPIHISDQWIEKVKSELPEFREEKAARYQSEFGLPEYDSQILTESRHLAGLFEKVATLCGNPKKAANWFMVEVLRLMKDKGVEAEKVRFSPQHLADLLIMVDKKEVSPQNAKRVFEKVFDEDIDPVAVSYTHLDVYKRQLTYWMWRMFFIKT